MSDAAPAAPAAPADVGAELSDVTDAATDGDATPEPVREPPRKHKVKVDDEEIEVDDDELKRGYQRAKAANKRFEESAKIRKQAEQFIAQLRNPESARKLLTNPKLGLDFKKLAEEYLAEQYESELLSPEEVRAREEQRELKRYREQEADTRKAADEAKEAEVREQMRGEYETKIIGALEAQNIPRTPETVRRMVDYASRAIKKGYELEMADIAELVREDYMADVKALLGPLDGDVLEQLLGADVSNKLRKSDLAKLRSARPGPQASRSTATGTPRADAARSGERRVVNSSDFLRSLRK